MKRLALALLGIVAVLVLLLVGLGGLLLGTESGVSWLLGQAQSMASTNSWMIIKGSTPR